MKASGAASLTAADVLQAGHWFLYASEPFEIMVWDSEKPLNVNARSANTGTERHFTILELFGTQNVTRFAPTRKELENVTERLFPRVADISTLPEHLLKRADHIIQTVDAVQSEIESHKRQCQFFGKPFSLTAATRLACQSIASPVSAPVYYVYQRLYREKVGDRALIASALHRKTWCKTQIEPNALHFIDTVIQRFYRSNPPCVFKRCTTLPNSCGNTIGIGGWILGKPRAEILKTCLNAYSMVAKA